VGTMTRRALATLVRDLIVSDSWIRRRRALDAHRCVSAVSLWNQTRSVNRVASRDTEDAHVGIVFLPPPPTNQPDTGRM
jgi:hypothetical protein